MILGLIATGIRITGKIGKVIINSEKRDYAKIKASNPKLAEKIEPIETAIKEAVIDIKTSISNK